MFSIWDIGNERYLYTGRNSSTKASVIDLAIRHFSDNIPLKEMIELQISTEKDKEDYLLSRFNVTINSHNEPIADFLFS